MLPEGRIRVVGDDVETGLGGGAAGGYAAAHQQYGNGTGGGANLGRNPSLGPSQMTSPSEYSSEGSFLLRLGPGIAMGAVRPMRGVER